MEHRPSSTLALAARKACQEIDGGSNAKKKRKKRVKSSSLAASSVVPAAAADDSDSDPGRDGGNAGAEDLCLSTWLQHACKELGMEGSTPVHNQQFLVLDEADRHLEVGFEGELSTILQSIPSNRQTLLFSATMTGKSELSRRICSICHHLRR